MENLDAFRKQNIAYGFSPDVMPSTLAPHRLRAAPNNVLSTPATLKKPVVAPAAPIPYGGSTGPASRPVIGKKNQKAAYAAPVPIDPYANGGDGTVAREAQPRDRTVDVGLGIPKDEMLRRMENASISMRGSPTARAAMMGVYADGLKSLDQVGINNAEGNSRNDGLAFQQNMQANMQQAQGKQQFGNDVALLNRKAGLDSAAAAANADPEMRALQLEKMRTDIDVNASTALRNKGEYEATIGAKQDAGITTTADKLFAGGKGGYATYADALNAATELGMAAGNNPRGTTPARAVDNALNQEFIGRLGKDDHMSEWISKGWDNASLGNEGLDASKQYSMDDFELVPEDSMGNSVRTAFGAEPIMLGKLKNGGLKRGDPTVRLLPGEAEDAALIKRFKARKMASEQNGQ